MDYFDLNIEKVLEHWPIGFAIREIIANALDEQAITATDDPTIRKITEGVWEISDFGRGLRYQHLTQKENTEKRRHRDVIGQFGMGLKDALAVFHRRGIDVTISSPHADITTVVRPKGGFTDITTLHAAVHPPSQPRRVGTTATLRGVGDRDIEEAKQFFLRYSGDKLLEETNYGQVLAKPRRRAPANIYVKGLLVAQEENFLFSYNVTSLTKGLRQALNRERSNVGRSAYADRIKAILKQCRTAEVAHSLAEDLAMFTTGRMHDELTWNDIALHACKVLATHDKVVFVSQYQLEYGGPQLDYARDEGYRLVLVPDDIAHRLGTLTDFDGNPLVDLDRYRDSWNDSFSFTFIDPTDLTISERQVFALTKPLIEAADIRLPQLGVRDILISETMRLNTAGREIVGVYEPAEKRIIIRRDRLNNPAEYCGTLLHELTHAKSGTTDGTLAFEEALTTQLGHLAVALLGTTAHNSGYRPSAPRS
ncbi:hypothetical protein AB0H42_32975 [Nocardia sp. NPDC050799]|uniref:hypothetical protein n=1 Tax=Nocardia sp. NPDC050799 TaxID=3154842 RepID=UPI0033EDFBC0